MKYSHRAAMAFHNTTRTKKWNDLWIILWNIMFVRTHYNDQTKIPPYFLCRTNIV